MQTVALMFELATVEYSQALQLTLYSNVQLFCITQYVCMYVYTIFKQANRKTVASQHI